MNPEIIFEDDVLLVFNKPSGLVVNISDTSPTGTLQNILQRQFEFPQGDTEFLKRNGIVHRLDKDTSGVLLVTKQEKAFENIKQQFIKRKVYKEYLALVLGRVEDPIFEIDAPLDRNPKNRMKMAIVKGGRKAHTKFELEKNLEIEGVETSWLKCLPITGRTHQIRAHLASVYHPVAGDPLYMTKKQQKQTNGIFKRLMLHAYKIKFNHPNLNKEVYFEAPLPEEFKKFI